MDIGISLYVASVLGAVALFMMMPREGVAWRRLGALLGAMTLGGLWLFLARYLPAISGTAAYYYIFSAIAIAAAARVITHKRPVYSALWFVLVVLASAGLLLIQGAEFMAFAMVIIYGGAIIVTYLFVIMLAAQAPRQDSENATDVEDSGGSGGGAIYDRRARDPLAAVAVGFLLLAALLSVAFSPRGLAPNPLAADPSDQQIISEVLTHRSPTVSQTLTLAGKPPVAPEPYVHVTNAERLGLDLFRGHPLGLELAGVILLVALVGAVVLARQKVERE
jgi:NADH-quinone oxidoreductase subunit J